MSIKGAIARSKVRARWAKQEREKRELASLKRQEVKALREAERQLALAEARNKVREAQQKRLNATQKARGNKGGLSLFKSDIKKLATSASRLASRLVEEEKPTRKRRVKKTVNRK